MHFEFCDAILFWRWVYSSILCIQYNFCFLFSHSLTPPHCTDITFLMGQRQRFLQFALEILIHDRESVTAGCAPVSLLGWLVVVSEQLGDCVYL